MRQLLDFDDDRKARNAVNERVFHRRANGLGEGQELFGLEVLVAQKDDAVIEPGATQRRQVLRT